MSRRRTLGLAAGACVACCAGPFFVAVGGIAALGAIGTIAFGVVALVVALVAVASLMALRRRSRSTDPGEVRVELGPTRPRPSAAMPLGGGASDRRVEPVAEGIEAGSGQVAAGDAS